MLSVCFFAVKMPNIRTPKYSKKKAVASIGRKAVLTNFFGFLALIGLFFYYGRHGNN